MKTQQVSIKRYVRPFAEVRQIMLERARGNRNPFDFTKYEDVERVFEHLSTLDRDTWAEAFRTAAEPYAARGEKAEAAGDAAAARENYLLAYNYERAGRYPAPNSPGKIAAYRREQKYYLKAARYFDPPLEQVEIPFQGRPGEGRVILGHLRRPKTDGPLPLIINWGGIDSFKEDRRAEPYLAAGFAALALDMPGVGDAPIAGSESAERMWDAVFDWIERQDGLDSRRVAAVGASTGGYWVTKLAHTHRDRLLAAVNHGGCCHVAFTAEWIEKAQHGEYPFELAETLACAFGRSTFEDWVEYAPRLSLVDQGILDQPCSALLCVNGIDDSVFPIADHYLLLQHGAAKSARFWPGGHMGPHAEVTPTVIAWLRQVLAA